MYKHLPEFFRHHSSTCTPKFQNHSIILGNPAVQDFEGGLEAKMSKFPHKLFINAKALSTWAAIVATAFDPIFLIISDLGFYGMHARWKEVVSGRGDS